MCSNIQGLRNNFDELKYVIKNRKPEVCFLNETHLTDNCDINDLKINKYKLITCNSYSRHTGGVCVYIDNSIIISNLKLIKKNNLFWILSFETQINNVFTVIACVYLSSSENKSLILDEFENCFEENYENKSIIMCGDFNINLLAENTYTRRLKIFFVDNGLTQIVNYPTRVTEHSISLIDLCISNMNKNKISCDVIQDEQISDHSMIEISINCKPNKSVIKNKTIDVCYNYDIERFYQSIDTWYGFWDNLQNESVDEKMNWLIMNLSTSAKLFSKQKVIKLNSGFFDYELEMMRREKNNLYKLAVYSGSNEKWHQYKEFKNCYKREIQTKKYNYNQKMLNNANGDIKKTWKILNSILNKECNEIISITDGNCHYTDDKIIANEFNKFFINSVVEINSNIPNYQYENDIIFTSTSKFVFRNVSIGEIKQHIKELKPNYDEFFLNTNIITDAVFMIGNILCNIINDSFDSGKFPSILKTSKITPIQKKPGTELIDEHRPINTLPCLEKLIEKIAFSQLNYYVNKNNILINHQSGFRHNHSCETALNDILFEWKLAINDSKVIIAVFLDFQRAFETIDINILLLKLQKYGITNNALKWFSNYLKGRSQYVVIRNEKSNLIQNNLGVPQGSILGPLLFLLYINDLGNCLQSSNIRMFADDTLIYIISDNLEIAQKLITDDLNRIYIKLCQNKLKLNTNKSNVLIISNSKIDKTKVNIDIGGQTLKIVEEVKYLGVIIDEKLKFDKNVNYICRKIGQKVNVLNRLRNQLNCQQKITIYKTLVQPHFIYCASVLFLIQDSDVYRLQKLQNKCMRNILRLNRYADVNLMLEKLNFMNVKQIIQFYTLIFLNKIVRGSAPKYLTEKIKYRNENSRASTLRNADMIQTTFVTKSFSRNSLFFRGINCYNALPKDITNELNDNSFNKKLKKHIMQNINL